uniref:SUN domain-containing protein n=1 Tax=Globisporangium ultimum (strain ATCC 200006 / CBS 805.95 / DAOM BR144) TaxID=431595 RepID=K3WP69_GLOUD
PVKDAPAEKTVNVDGTISSTGAPRNALDAAAKSANGAAKPVQVTESQADEGRGGVSIRGDYIEDDFESIDLPSSLFEIEDKDSGGRRQNYALLDAGATILDSSPETKSPTNLLVPDKDRYMLIPCEKTRKWVVVSLSEDVHADAIAIANYEKFSSPVKDFIVLGSVNYPTDTWFVLGNFTAAYTNGEQVFHLDSQYHVRYIKLRFFSHYGSEYYCTLSQLKVFGRTFTQVISQLEKSIDAETVLESAALPLPLAPAQALPDTLTVDSSSSTPASTADASSTPPGNDPIETGFCQIEERLVDATAMYDESQRLQYHLNHDMCRLDQFDDHASILAEADAVLAGLDRHAASSERKEQGEEAAGRGSANESPRPGTNGSSLGTAGADGEGAKTNKTATATTASVSPPLPVASVNSGAPPQGLGRLESIFVRITKKIQALELNQSVFGRQMEEFQQQQRAATRDLQMKQDALTEQLNDIRTLLTDLKGTVTKELSGKDSTLNQYGRILEEVQRENIALWNEMLVVREVITTMKAGILCALVLSAFIITFYLLRLLFRCVAACKERADHREWFWRMENQASSAQDENAKQTRVAASGASTPSSDVGGAGSLRVNRRQQFGSSWDDSAIERKTLMSDMVDGPQKYRRHRTKKSRTSSLTYGPTIQRIVK